MSEIIDLTQEEETIFYNVDEPNHKGTSRAYAFTSYADGIPQWNPETMGYLVFQREKCPTTQREHWQGFVRFKKNYTYRQAWEQLQVTNNGKMFKPKGTDEQNRKYCTKMESRIDGPWEYGTCGKRQGERTDIAEALETAKTHGIKRAAEEHGNTMVKYHKGIEWVLRTLAKPEVDKDEWKDWQPRAWQARVLERLKTPPVKRTIWYFHDADGGQGKSTLARYLAMEMKAALFDITSGKDVAYAWNGEPIVIFDLARAQTKSEAVNWSTIEKVKDGCLFSGKYESTMKIFKVPHVLVFANHLPPEDTYSKDRLFVITMPTANFPILP